MSPLASLDFAGIGKAQGQLSDELEIHRAQRSHFSSTQTLSELLGECIHLQSVERPWGLVFYFYVELLLGLACRFQGAMSCNDMHDNFQAQFRLVDLAMRLRD